MTKSSSILTLALLLAVVPVAAAYGCDGSPLILDLNGDGIRTTDLFYPVTFDINGNGTKETIAWTSADSEDAFLWMDRNGDGIVDNGSELFGDATHLADGSTAANGFAALAEWDRPALGGNRDGLITPADRIWSRLRLWIDRNHDGVSQSSEIYRLGDYGIFAIRLDYTYLNQEDGNGNNHLLRGWFRRVLLLPNGRPEVVTQVMEDVYLHFNP